MKQVEEEERLQINQRQGRKVVEDEEWFEDGDDVTARKSPAISYGVAGHIDGEEEWRVASWVQEVNSYAPRDKGASSAGSEEYRISTVNVYFFIYSPSCTGNRRDAAAIFEHA
jgi:hypothetical protein